MKRLAITLAFALSSASVNAEESMYAYCMVRPNDGKNISYVSKVFTVTQYALQTGGVPDMAVLPASYQDDDLQGQFYVAVEKEGLERRDAACFAAGTRDDLEGHYREGSQRLTRVKERFAEWEPKGDFLLASEPWQY